MSLLLEIIQWGLPASFINPFNLLNRYLGAFFLLSFCLDFPAFLTVCPRDRVFILRGNRIKSIKAALAPASSPRCDFSCRRRRLPDWSGSQSTPTEMNQTGEGGGEGKNGQVSNRMKWRGPRAIIKSLQCQSPLEEAETCNVCFSFVKDSQKSRWPPLHLCVRWFFMSFFLD